LTLKYYAGLSYAEICQVMQVERPALTSLLYRARMMLRKLLEQDHER
ncbi:MAG: RNA polymerase sigma factor, partial [Pseudomonas stutzeri]|nr:RNA polymerase sigma factor [Stutzerimonas stutzeri]NIN81840.1 RNA polymerase sigma factor [Stutzerimonas stutzeri]NIQ23688.1 RNA polymerase sigma factor [Stutzerimonas stutzeri]NIQ42436.1 RNA polymerase sigma factor [Stutzerimonas stutzeri]NIS57860.1 RNA polymerase sigma factor [Stutzerimonas stutzeri]